MPKGLPETEVKDVIALDMNFVSTRIANSDVSHINVMLTKDGTDRGRALLWSSHRGGESHETSRNAYDGCSDRLRLRGYRPKVAIFDNCCGNALPQKVRENKNVLSQVFGLESPPKGDAFHMLQRFDEFLNCVDQGEFKSDIHKVLFEDCTDFDAVCLRLPKDWKDSWEFVEKDGSMSDEFDPSKFEQPSFFARKLIAFSKCFEGDLPSHLLSNPRNKSAKKVKLLRLALKNLQNKYCKFVPQVIRAPEEALAELSKVCEKWFGFPLKRNGDNIEIDFSSATREEWIPDDFALKYDASSENYRDASVQRQLQKNYKILVKDGGAWRDRNGVAWKSTLADHRFAKARIFAPGSDEKTLGKDKSWTSILNLASHLSKGCMDYTRFGDDLFENVGGPIASGQFRGLLACTTKAGKNLLEALFRLLNQATALTAYYGNPECEVRLSHGLLEYNHGADQRNDRNVAPTPIYWFWRSLNQLSLALFGKENFVFRDPAKLDLPSKPYMGFRAYRYETALKIYKKPHHAALAEAAKFTLSNSAVHRWLQFDSWNLQDRPPPDPRVVAKAVMADMLNQLEAEEAERLAKQQKAKKKRARQVQRDSEEAAKKTARRTDDSLISSSLRVPQRLTKQRDVQRVHAVVSKVVATNDQVLNGDNSVNTRRLCEAVATEFNEGVLRTSSGQSSVLATKRSVKDVLKCRVKASSSSTSCKRPLKKDVDPKGLKWHLTVNQLLGGCLTYKEATRYFSCLKAWMKKSSIAAKLKLNGLTKQLKLVMHGLRMIFMANKLTSIEYVRSTNSFKLTKLRDAQGVVEYKFCVKNPKKTPADGKVVFADEDTTADCQLKGGDSLPTS